MRIPALPQVEFDSFPTDETTKVCIFTKPPYPVPDLSHAIQDENRQLILYCTESTVLTIARFAKKLPIELFDYLPTGKKWLLIDGADVNGLDTPFRVACLPTGSVSDSVMLMIFTLNDPTKITLYTGTFQKCREVLISDFFIKYKKFMSDVYIDNTFANSEHVDIIQDARACNDIKNIVDTYPNHKIHLQMEMFATMDLLVELAQRHHINVQLNILQQIFFYKSEYKYLFHYDANIPNAADLNKKFLFRNQPEVLIMPYEAADIEAYKMYFHTKEIITIRLIASERYIDVTPETVEKGLVYITHAGHAGAATLHSLIHAIKPKRIHPLIDDGPDDNLMSRIPPEILNDDCAITYDSQSQPSRGQFLEVTLDDIKPAPKQRSFLHITTILSGDEVSELESISDDCSPNSGKSNQNRTNAQSSGVSSDSVDDEPVIIEISDDESDTLDALCRIPNKKRSLPESDNQKKSKYSKPNGAKSNEIGTISKKSNGKQSAPANESNQSHCPNETTKAIYADEDEYEEEEEDDHELSSLSSHHAQLVFPTD